MARGRHTHLVWAVASLVALTGGLMTPASAEDLPPVAAGDPSLPNLVVSRALGIRVGSIDAGHLEPFNGLGALRFNTSLANLGPGHLEIVPVPNQDSVTALAAQTTATAIHYSCIARIQDTCTGWHPMGSYTWNPGYQSLHMESLLVYELRRLGPTGAPDFSPQGLVASNFRHTTCIYDAFPVGGGGGDDYEPNDPYQLMPFCLPVYWRLSAGWTVVLRDHLYEQYLNIVDVPDGDYALVIRANVNHEITESTYDDNQSVQRLRLSASGTQVDLLA
jgi:hypothetical protein